MYVGVYVEEGVYVGVYVGEGVNDLENETVSEKLPLSVIVTEADGVNVSVGDNVNDTVGVTDCVRENDGVTEGDRVLVIDMEGVGVVVGAGDGTGVFDGEGTAAAMMYPCCPAYSQLRYKEGMGTQLDNGRRLLMKYCTFEPLIKAREPYSVQSCPGK